mmetsp:Transcript_7658/g.13798  ORF Transcript_7658/g.13798 Transcript_7658/m.13798 type:complete len:240 (+) Transcript_7658:1242-1961(+)
MYSIAACFPDSSNNWSSLFPITMQRLLSSSPSALQSRVSKHLFLCRASSSQRLMSRTTKMQARSPAFFLIKSIAMHVLPSPTELLETVVAVVSVLPNPGRSMISILKPRRISAYMSPSLKRTGKLYISSIKNWFWFAAHIFSWIDRADSKVWVVSSEPYRGKRKTLFVHPTDDDGVYSPSIKALMTDDFPAFCKPTTAMERKLIVVVFIYTAFKNNELERTGHDCRGLEFPGVAIIEQL